MAARSAEIVWQPVPDCLISFSGDRAGAIRSKPGEDRPQRISPGMLPRCHDPECGLARDRAHWAVGVFDSVTSSGLHAMTSAAAAAEGILDRETVAAEVRKTAPALLAMPKAAGFLPHLTRRDGRGQPVIHPGNEFSTVYTAIALHVLRPAATVLELPDVADAVAARVADLDFDGVSDPEGWIGHGFHQDGHTLLAPVGRLRRRNRAVTGA